MTETKRESYQTPSVRRVSLAATELAATACKTKLTPTAFGLACVNGTIITVKTAGS